MEALSPTMEEGQVVTWLKAEGDAVAQGDILAEIETDKATMELVARGEGVLRKIFVAAGATAPVGDVIAVIGAEDEDIAALVASAGPAATSATPAAAEAAATGAEPATQAEPAAQPGPASTPAEAATHAGPADTGTGGPAPASAAPVSPQPTPTPAATTGRIKASPVARRLAGELGVDLATVHGSGPNGRVIKRDVEAAAAAPAPAVAPRSHRPSRTRSSWTFRCRR